MHYIYNAFRRSLDGKMCFRQELCCFGDGGDDVAAEAFLKEVWCILSTSAPHLRRSFELPKAERSDLDPL